MVGRLGNDNFSFVALACSIIPFAVVDEMKELTATGAEYAVQVLQR